MRRNNGITYYHDNILEARIVYEMRKIAANVAASITSHAFRKEMPVHISFNPNNYGTVLQDFCAAM